MKHSLLKWFLVICFIGLVVSTLVFTGRWALERSLGEGTLYSSRYNEALFRSIAIGDSQQHLIEELGKPLRYEPVNEPERWRYLRQNSDKTIKSEGSIKVLSLGPNPEDYSDLIYDENGRLIEVRGMLLKGIDLNADKKTIEKKFGAPHEIAKSKQGIWMEFSAPEDSTNKTFYVRRVFVNSAGRVEEIDSRLAVD